MLVHCLMGVSRSAAVVMAFLMRRHQDSFVPTLARVRALRKVVNPNLGFRLQLQLFQEHGWAVQPEWWHGWDMAQFVAERARRAALEDGILLLRLGGTLSGAAQAEAPLLLTDSAPSSPAAPRSWAATTTDIWDPAAWEEAGAGDAPAPVPVAPLLLAGGSGASGIPATSAGATPPAAEAVEQDTCSGGGGGGVLVQDQAEQLAHALLALPPGQPREQQRQQGAPGGAASPIVQRPRPLLAPAAAAARATSSASSTASCASPSSTANTTARRHSQPGNGPHSGSRLVMMTRGGAPPLHQAAGVQHGPEAPLPLAVSLRGPLAAHGPGGEVRAPSWEQEQASKQQPVDAARLAQELLQLAAAPLPGDASLGGGGGGKGSRSPSSAGSECSCDAAAPVVLFPSPLPPVPLGSKPASGGPLSASGGATHRRRRFQAPPGGGARGSVGDTAGVPAVPGEDHQRAAGGGAAAAAAPSSGGSAWQSRRSSRDGPGLMLGEEAPAALAPQAAWNGRPGALLAHPGAAAPLGSATSARVLLPPLLPSCSSSPGEASGQPPQQQGRSASCAGLLATACPAQPQLAPTGGVDACSPVFAAAGLAERHHHHPDDVQQEGAGATAGSALLPAMPRAQSASWVRAWPTLQLPGSPHGSSHRGGSPGTSCSPSASATPATPGSRTPSSSGHPSGGQAQQNFASGRSPRLAEAAEAAASSPGAPVASPGQQAHQGGPRSRRSDTSGGVEHGTPSQNAGQNRAAGAARRVDPWPPPGHTHQHRHGSPSAPSASAQQPSPPPSASPSGRPPLPGSHALPRVPPPQRPGGSSGGPGGSTPPHAHAAQDTSQGQGRGKPSLTLPSASSSPTGPAAAPRRDSPQAPAAAVRTSVALASQQPSPVLSPAPASPRLPTQGSGQPASPRTRGTAGSEGLAPAGVLQQQQQRDAVGGAGGEPSRLARSSDLVFLLNTGGGGAGAAAAASAAHSPVSAARLRGQAPAPVHSASRAPAPAVVSSAGCLPCHRSRSVDNVLQPLLAGHPPAAAAAAGKGGASLSSSSAARAPQRSVGAMAPPRSSTTTSAPTQTRDLAAAPHRHLDGTSTDSAPLASHAYALQFPAAAGEEAAGCWGRTDSVAATAADEDLVERLMDMALASLPPAMLLQQPATQLEPQQRVAGQAAAAAAASTQQGGVDDRGTPLPPWPHYLVLQPIHTPPALQSDLTSGLEPAAAAVADGNVPGAG